MSVQTWTPRPELVGARWSSAVRCIAKAEYQALGVPGDPNAQAHLADAFARGVNAADNWVRQIAENYRLIGQQILTEVPIAWGPGNVWHGHADIVIPDEQRVLEAYHSVGGEFRAEKALQVAFYARKLGPGYTAELHALDTTKLVPDDGGFEITSYQVDVDGLADQVNYIEEAVIAAHAAGEVNLDDRVGDGPDHPECKQCPFREACWADFEPTVMNLPDLANALDRLVLAQANARHLKTAHEEADELVRELKAGLRPYVRPGETLRAGGIQVKRVHTAPRKGFKLTDYLKAGHQLTPTMRDFATESDHEGERWYVKRVSE